MSKSACQASTRWAHFLCKEGAGRAAGKLTSASFPNFSEARQLINYSP